MVSPVDSSKELSVTRTALKALGLKFDQASVGSSVLPMPDEMGYVVTVVHIKESISVHLLHVDLDGNSRPFGQQ